MDACCLVHACLRDEGENQNRKETDVKQHQKSGSGCYVFFSISHRKLPISFSKNSCHWYIKKITCMLLNDFTTFIDIVPIFFPFAGKEAISWLNQMIISITTINNNNNNNSSSSNNNSPENQDMWIVGLKLKLKWTLMPPSSATEDVKGIESNHLIWS